ncbi:hypothetical protein [Kitasatospora sp. NPDC050463]|uniref:hypothetical protein n=1 Tax=Kitasatospora sp. NPDC050463 TaxID=3155786 RepID=UPI0033FCCCDA
MRALRLASVAVAAAVLSGGLSACSSGGGGGTGGTADTKAAGDAIAGKVGDLDPRAALAASAVVMQRAGNGSLTLSTDSDTLTGAGDWRQQTAVDLAGKDKTSTKVRVLGDDVYLGGGPETTVVLGGRHWAKVLPKDPIVGSMSVLFLTMAQMTNPVLQLSAAQSGKLTKIGTETVGGAQATHYRAVEDTAKVAEGLTMLGGDQRAAVRQTLDAGGSTLTVDFWINSGQQLVQLKEYGDKGGEASAVTVTYAGLGAAPKIEAPAASDVGSGADLAKGFKF